MAFQGCEVFVGHVPRLPIDNNGGFGFSGVSCALRKLSETSVCLCEKIFKSVIFDRLHHSKFWESSKTFAICVSNHAGAYAAVVFLFCLGLLERAIPLHDGHSFGLILYAAAKEFASFVFDVAPSQ
ncbi:unnamed protein product [Diatraea saccharalis]|uniref:Uncharacterized protein n=1 Tax=Diatraea saccharalis TaxID=40085 RepID=A0A9N9WK15_9NEOP|nr:unnamed protein product [Diatraea saccharalis]